MRIKAVVAREIGRLSVEEIELDPPRENEVLVRMYTAGVCHSDLHTYRGELRAEPPLVLGHEGAGVIETIGSNVTRVRPGQRVMINWIPACETCPTCLSGRQNLCEGLRETTFKALLLDGTSRLHTDDGLTLKHYLSSATMAEYAVVHENSAIPIPEEVPFDVAAITGCAVATGVGAVINTASVKPGLPAAIIGCGGVGLSAIQGCVLAGSYPILAVDVVSSKLDFAVEMGATHTLLVGRRDARAGGGDTEQEGGDEVPGRLRGLDELAELTGGGPEYVFDSVGSRATIPQALTMTRPGGTAVIIGMHAFKEEIAIPSAALVAGNRRLLGCFVGSMRPRIDLPLLIDLYCAGKLKLDEMISRRYPMEEIQTAFADLEAGVVARGLLEMRP